MRRAVMMDSTSGLQARSRGWPEMGLVIEDIEIPDDVVAVLREIYDHDKADQPFDEWIADEIIADWSSLTTYQSAMADVSWDMFREDIETPSYVIGVLRIMCMPGEVT